MVLGRRQRWLPLKKGFEGLRIRFDFEYQNRLLEELMLKEYSIYLECLSWVRRNIGHLIEQKIVSHLFREKDYMS